MARQHIIKVMEAVQFNLGSRLRRKVVCKVLNDEDRTCGWKWSAKSLRAKQCSMFYKAAQAEEELLLF
jgi:hypothetical protein